MPLIKRAYKRSEEDEDGVGSEVKVNEEEKITTEEEKDIGNAVKKRPSAFAVQAAAKLLKLTENVGNDNLHSIDIANQLLDRNTESNIAKKSSAASTGPRSLLDMLPTPKSSNEDTTSVEEAEEHSSVLPSSQQEPKEKAKNNDPSPATSTFLTAPKTMKTKSLSPDVHFDESLLKVVGDDETVDATSGTKKTSVGPAVPVRLVGPSRPAYLSATPNNTSTEDEDSVYIAHQQAQYGQQTSASSSGTLPQHDPSFGIVDGSAQVVELNVGDLMRGPIHSAPLPDKPNLAAASRLGNISRTAKGKNQITYLAAIAGETERHMQAKKLERSRNQQNKF